MMDQMRLLLPVIVPIALGLLGRALRVRGRALRVYSVYASALGGVLAAVCALWPEGGELTLRWTDMLSLTLRVDDLSRIYLLLLSLLWPGAALYAAGYLEHSGHNERYTLFYLLTQGVLHALSMSGNLVTFYTFYEAMTVLTVPLVLHNQDREAVAAAMKYLVYSVIGASAALIGIFFIASLGASGDFAAGVLAGETLNGREGFALAIFFVMLLGFGVKAGMFPFHGWLPTAHPVAPAPASAVLSGVITKMGVLGAVRVIYYVAGADRLRGTWVQAALLCLSLITVLMGSTMAFKEKKLKKRLAYSSVSQVSYVLFGLFTMTEAGFVGALLHVVFHALMKNTLFMGAGNIIHQTEKTQVDELDGLGKAMPWTYAFFAVASLGLVGIPPTGGFISKWSLAQGALATGLPGAWIGPAALLVSAVLTAGYLLSLVIRGCFPGEDKGAAKKSEVGWRMLLPMGVYGALIVLLGVFSAPMIQYFTALARGLM